MSCLRKLIEVLREDEDAKAEEWPCVLPRPFCCSRSITSNTTKNKEVRLLLLHTILETITIYALHVPGKDPRMLQRFQHICHASEKLVGPVAAATYAP